MSLHVALSHLYSPSLVNSWALCLSVPLKKSMLGCTCCKVKYHGWIFECIFVYKTGRPSWMNLLVGPLAVGTPWSTDDLPPGATGATGIFVRWPGGEEVAELVPTGATAPKVNTKRRDLDSKSLADLVEISLKDVERRRNLKVIVFILYGER